MPNVPLPRGISGLSSTPKQQEMLVNLYWTENGIYRTPGIEAFETIGDAITESGCRGAGVWYADGYAYFVIGSRAYRVAAGNVVTDIGGISGTEECIFSQGQTTMVILVKGGDAYAIIGAFGVMVQITDPDYLPSVSVDYIDGRHVFVPADGSPPFYSDIDVSYSISPLSFFDAEELPDINKVTVNIGNILFVGGTQSFEQFRSTGDSNAPFERRNGGRVDVGYVAGLLRYKGTFAFIGKRRDHGHAFYLMGSGDAPQISTPRINEILNGFSLEEIEACDADSFEWNGSTFALWTIGSYTIAFVDGNWSYIDSDLNGTAAGPWRGRGVVFYAGQYLLADRNTGRLGVLANVPGEYGGNVEYWLQTFVRGARNSNFSAKALEVDVLTGQGAKTIGLSVSDDARTWSDFEYLDLGDIGEYERRIVWDGGLGRYENYMGVILRGTGQVKFALESMEVTA